MMTLLVAGFALQLLGLGWDAIEHRIDPALAAREGVFSLGSLSHLVFAVGLAVSVVGLLGSLVVRGSGVSWPTWMVWRLRAGFAAGLLIIFATASSFSVWRGPSLEAASTHAVPLADRDAELKADLDARQAAGRISAQEASYILQRVQGMVHPGGEGVPISAAELDAATQLVSSVRRDTNRLTDVHVAEEEGYRPIPVGSRGGVVHYSNETYYGRVLDTEHPQQVIYRQQPEGTMELVGVLFLMPYGVPGPRIGGPLTAWHAHDDVCINPATYVPVGSTDAAGQCPPNAVRRTSSEMLHVWLADNPRGVFDSWMQPNMGR
jgi:hypothetical protein